MAFEAPVDSYDPDRTFDGPAPGQYHVQVVSVDEDGGSKGEMIVDFEVLAGSTANQEGMRQREYFQKTVKAMGRIHTLATSLGMVSKDDIKRHKAAGTSPTYDFASQAGKQLCIELEDHEWNGKHTTKAAFGFYRVTDEKVKNWKKHSQMLAKAGYAVPASTNGSAASKPGATAPSSINDDLLDDVV